LLRQLEAHLAREAWTRCSLTASAKTQDNEVGDGTTTAVVLAGELLKRAEELLDQEIHPAIISNGYRLACEKAVEILNEIAVPISKEDDEILKKIAMTAMTGKGAEVALEKLADIVVRAVKAVTEEVDGPGFRKAREETGRKRRGHGVGGRNSARQRSRSPRNAEES